MEKWKRLEEKEKNKHNWYRTGKKVYEAPLFVPWSQNGELEDACQEIVDKNFLKVKAVEKTGRKVKDCLQKSSIERKINFPEGCHVCKTDNKISCLTTDVTYKMNCPNYSTAEKPLKIGYDGETARI